MMDKTTLLRRRDFLRLTALSSASYLLFSGQKCNENKGADTPKPPLPPEPVYELTDGKTLYDNFDGEGGLQSYNNQHLAVSGSLSSALWDHGPSSTVVDNPSSQVYAVVNEHGQRVEYGWENNQVQELIRYLHDNPRPIDRYERRVLQGLLNERGSELVSFIEERDIEKQVKTIQYVLNKRDMLFNEKGRKIIQAVTRFTATDFNHNEYQELLKQGLDENELAVLSNLIVENRIYDNIKNSPIRRTINRGRGLLKTGLGYRPELREIKYVFDKDDHLIEATPHVPGQPYHGSKELRWINKDGEILVRAEVVPVFTQSGNGNVVRATVVSQGENRLELNNQEDIDFVDYKSFSADVMLSSESKSKGFKIALDFHTSIPEQGGISWLGQIKLTKDMNWDGKVYVASQCMNKNTIYKYGELLQEAMLDIWYNLRMDIVTKEEDDSLKDSELRFDFYIDGKKMASEIPADSEILLNPDRLAFGPKRSFELRKYDEEPGDAIMYIDNVKAVYRNRIS